MTVLQRRRHAQIEAGWHANVVRPCDDWPVWYRALAHPLEGEENGFVAFVTIRCPHGHLTTMSHEVHEIIADGLVHPSYVCTAEGCSFHEFLRLEGWPPVWTPVVVPRGSAG